MDKRFKLSAFVLSVAFALPGHADYLDNIGPSVGTSAPAPGAAASSGDKVLNQQCKRNHGILAINEQTGTNALFERVGLSPALVSPLTRHAVRESKCFELPGRGSSMARYELKVQGPNATLAASDGSVARGAAAGAISAIPIFGAFGAAASLAAHNAASSNVKFIFSDSQVVLTVVDLETGEPVATAVGVGKKGDVDAGAALLSNATGILSGAPSQDASMQVVATSFADALNQLVPALEKLSDAIPTPAAQSVEQVPVKEARK